MTVGDVKTEAIEALSERHGEGESFRAAIMSPKLAGRAVDALAAAGLLVDDRDDDAMPTSPWTDELWQKWRAARSETLGVGSWESTDYERAALHFGRRSAVVPDQTKTRLDKAVRYLEGRREAGRSAPILSILRGEDDGLYDDDLAAVISETDEPGGSIITDSLRAAARATDGGFA